MSHVHPDATFRRQHKATKDLSTPQLRALRKELLIVRADVERMVAETVGRYGSVDVLVNNAHGFGARAPLEEIPEAQFDL